MKNEKIVNAWDKLDPSGDEKNRIFDKIEEKRQIKRGFFRPAAIIATAAAVICIFLLGLFVLTPHTGNTFVLKAYAIELDADGLIEIREIELVEQVSGALLIITYKSELQDGMSQIESVCVNLGIRGEGQNIKSIEYSTNVGFLQKRYIYDTDNDASTQAIPTDPHHWYTIYQKPGNPGYTEIAVSGYRFVIEEDELADNNYLLYWGTERVNDLNNVPDEVSIQVKATFADGGTAEQIYTLNLSEAWKDTEKIIDWHGMDVDAQREFYMNIPLEECELIPESVQTVTDIFEYEHYYSSGGGINSRVISFQNFEDGWIRPNIINRVLWGDYLEGYQIDVEGDHRGYLVIIECDSDGVMAGMMYKTPVRER